MPEHASQIDSDATEIHIFKVPFCRRRPLLMLLAAAAVIITLAGTLFHYWPRTLALHPAPAGLAIEWDQGKLRLHAPDRRLLSEIAEYDSELLAYLMYDYLRSRAALKGTEIFLSHREQDGQPQTSVQLALDPDFLEALPLLVQWREDGYTAALSYGFVPQETRDRLRMQTRVFADAYDSPVHQKLENIPPDKLARYVRRFIRFKSLTDPRVRRRLPPNPKVLTSEQAQRLAGDILMVSAFYQVPLDLFLGVGAMENNYMNVPGDLQHTSWKRRAQPGDVVVKRARGRVLVRNDALGVWQITRETLRYAHSLYLADKRNYEDLPERLRPPRTLDFGSVQPEVLTTYAGLLLRDLLDYFHGDATLAIGAYNGGVARPNANYEAGVRRVAEYARKVLEHAAAIQARDLSRAALLGTRTRHR